MTTLKQKTALREHSKSFYWASLFLGRKTAAQVTQLYAFCRAVDDLADKELDKSKACEELNAWLTQLKKGTSCELRAHTIMELVQAMQLDTHHLALLIEGVLSDFGLVNMQDESELRRYCYLVAGTVGLMMCQILGAKNPHAKKFAIDLGIAMQLTNILRDVAEDAAAGRQYIPQSWLPDQHGLLELAATKSVTAKEAFQRLFDLAEVYYASGYEGLRYLPIRCRFSILVAARLYREIGIQAKRCDFAIWDQRIVVSNKRKCWLISLCALRFTKDLIFPKPKSPHDATLHAAFMPLINT
jgi:phytoene synthase